MTTFQTAVEGALDGTDAEFESLVVAGDAMELGYRVPTMDDGKPAERAAAVAAAYLLAVRDGAGRPELTVYVYDGTTTVPAASYCIEADWARACILGDSDYEQYLQRVLDTFATRRQRMAGKVSVVEA